MRLNLVSGLRLLLETQKVQMERPLLSPDEEKNNANRVTFGRERKEAAPVCMEGRRWQAVAPLPSSPPSCQENKISSVVVRPHQM